MIVWPERAAFAATDVDRDVETAPVQRPGEGVVHRLGAQLLDEHRDHERHAPDHEDGDDVARSRVDSSGLIATPTAKTPS